MLDERKRKVIVDSFRLVVPIAETAADLFYGRLFELRPSYAKYFKADLSSQKRKLITMLSFIVKSLDYPDSAWGETVAEESDLFMVVLALGRRHAELYKIPDESYGPVGEALIWALDYGLGDAFTPEVKEAWVAIYKTLALTMQMSTTATVNLNQGRVA